jgi:hypothetical protein
MSHSFFTGSSGEKLRDVIAASSLRFPSPLLRATQSQRQSQCGKMLPSRCACRLVADGSLPLVRHFARFAHGVPGALRAWAPPLGGIAGVSRLSRTECGIGAGRATSTILESLCDLSPVARAFGRGCKEGAQALTLWDAGLCPPLKNRTLGRPIRCLGADFSAAPPGLGGYRLGDTFRGDCGKTDGKHHPLPCPTRRYFIVRRYAPSK